ncbi:unnamed protein product [Effrenium voratum]|nr:unnamed protein product [Effrenium voratum]CAJ1376716.1 unnamed protein product [Effrenium voratum]CAJ1441005.1 unnamed protein product [Effrenium voratum]
MLEPELYMAQAMRAHRKKELHKPVHSCEQVLPTSGRQHDSAAFMPGDLIVLGEVPGYVGATAVVMEVTPVDCKVAILDASRTSTAERHVRSSDLRLIHQHWRIGARHVIEGLSRMKHLNGLIATVREHRRYGHPCFVRGDSGDRKLRLCVRWENAETSGALLLETRFLRPEISESSASERPPDNTLLTAKRRAASSSEDCDKLSTPSLRAIDELEPTPCHESQVESVRPLPSCSSSFLTTLSWLVGAHTRPVEDEFPTVIRLSSVLAADDPQPREQLSWLLPIAETEDDAELISEPTEVHSFAEVQPGDLALLDRSFQPAKYANTFAVVKGADPSGFTVAILDTSRSVFVGECYAGLADIQLIHSDWRIGRRVVLGGLQSSHMTHLNGLSAVICPHKRHGHPCFVQKPSAPKTGEWLTLCIRFEDVAKSKMHAVLLEPRFLTPDEKGAFTPCGTPAHVPKSMSLNDHRTYQKQMSGTSQGSLKRPSLQSKQPKLGRYQKSSTMSSTSPGSVFRQWSSPSLESGDSRMSFRERMPEEDVAMEIKELKESLRSLAREG